MDYLEFKIACKEEFKEILIAELAEIGFDSFLETEEGIEAYVEENDFERKPFDALVIKYKEVAEIQVTEGKMAKVNWNEEWEKHYDPILVENKVYVRASFHPPMPHIPYEILINPKMSFGTGHHATTFLMLTHQLTIDHKGKKVCDVGSGTGILAIMAKKLGAKHIEAFDIDAWSVENGNENFDLNGMGPVRMGLGTITEVKPSLKFDILLANINKNVLLEELPIYADNLKTGGFMLLSGFYEYDVVDLVTLSSSLGLDLERQNVKNEWAALVLTKKS
ncbi:50S ribosomal protein L11 methyltransferase [Pararhodonellum marinum]|uniref:50S ribosomal protein L11 methyltransferase n=1 Tax=Pararhodonellum marinum TaxID=2755358 RepID=UPI00188DF11B|nr:50S ribosomal protein L11 methyltransferase [Pararhodonellum marinum]